MPNICVSYRRADAKAIAGRIYDRLCARYSIEAVFFDVDKIPAGTDFRTHIQEVLDRSDVVLVIVGSRWVGPQDGSRARIHDQDDPVRVEVQTALTKKLNIIPLLVDGATMPSAAELPEGIKPFAYRNALPVDSGRDFKMHIERVIQAIDQVAPDKGGRPATRSQSAAGVPGASAGAAAPTAAGFSLSEAAGYALLPVVVLLLAHYLVVIALKLNTDYPLRAVAIVVPAVTGFLMLRHAERGQGAAWAIGTVMAVVAVIGMWTVQGLSTGTPILPTSAYDWRESFEYLATITCATVAGNLIGRMILASPGK